VPIARFISMWFKGKNNIIIVIVLLMLLLFCFVSGWLSFPNKRRAFMHAIDVNQLTNICTWLEIMVQHMHCGNWHTACDSRVITYDTVHF